MPIHIIIDDREPQAMDTLFAQNNGLFLKRQRLPTGDYLINDRLLVERKTIADLAASIVDGRLFRQAMGLASSEHLPLLIIEGSPEEYTALGISRQALQGSILSLSLIFGIPLLHSGSLQETAWLILAAARQVHRVEMGSVNRAGYRPKGRRKRQLFILQGLPGIGRERAELLLEYFGSVRAVIEAEENELLQVRGVGKETAKSIREVLKEEPAGYGRRLPLLNEIKPEGGL